MALRRGARAVCLLAVVLVTLAAGKRDNEDAIKLQLPADGNAVQAFISKFGPAKRMTASQASLARDRSYVPKGLGPAYGVPEVVTQGIGYKNWNNDMLNCPYYGCPQPAPNPEPYFPTIYDWVSANPTQTISKQIMDIIGAEVFQGAFTGTLLLPTDSAWAMYLSRFRVPVQNTTNDRAEQFFANFFIRLLQYHTLLLKVYGAQLDGKQYSTVYTSLNASPHKVTFGRSSCSGGSCGGGCNGCNSQCSAGCSNPAMPACPTCDAWYGNGGWKLKKGKPQYYFYSPTLKKQNKKYHYPPCNGGCNGGCAGGCNGGCAGGCNGGCAGGCSGGCNGGGCAGGGCNGGGCAGGGCNGGCGAPANFLIDEQRNVVTFDQVDKFVFGGGVIHTINQVLEPNDIFPSLTAALNSSAAFSDLRLAFDRIADPAEGNFSMLASLEEIPGTMAMPTNQAFAGAGVNVATAPVGDVLNIVAYHFCAFTRAYRLLYYPFNGRPGKNPCLTILSRAYNLDYGLSWNKRYTGVGQMPEMWITYATGDFNNLVARRANLETSDLTMPVHSAAILRDLIVPPSNLPSQNRAAVASAAIKASKVKAQVDATIKSASIIDDGKQPSSRSRRFTRRAQRRAAQVRAAAATQDPVEYEELDADEDDEQAYHLKSPMQLVRDAVGGQGRKLLS